MANSVGLEWYKTGTVNITQGSTTVTGVNTNWATAGIKKGDIFTIDDTRLYEIADVAGNTSITLNKPYQGAGGSAQSYGIIRNFAATMQAEIASQVAGLVNKYDTYIDTELQRIVGPKGDPGWAYKGAWASGRSYNAMDVVTQSGALHVALSAHTSASANAPGANGSAWMSLGMNLQQATESVAGITKLASAANVRGRASTDDALTINRISDIYVHSGNNRNIFTNFNPDTMMGVQYVYISTVGGALPGSPMFELYGLTQNCDYIVQTKGYMTSQYYRFEQTAEDNISGRKFFRKARYDAPSAIAWSKWTELATLSYCPWYTTIILDVERGDDTTANGSESKPYKTLIAALNAVPKIIGSWAFRIRIKPGLYQVDGPEASFYPSMGGYLWMEPFSGEKDVEIMFSDRDAELTRGLSLHTMSGLRMKDIKFSKQNGLKKHTGLYMTYIPYANIVGCEFEGFQNGVVVTGSQASLEACTYTNCTNGIWTGNASVVTHSGGSASGTDYVLTTDGSIIVKRGQQPAGNIATERVISGKII